MAHFYGIVRGAAKSEATRRGTPNSGIGTTAASWNGAVSVELYVDEEGNDCACVSLEPWHGKGVSRTLYRGPVNPKEEEPEGKLGFEKE